MTRRVGFGAASEDAGEAVRRDRGGSRFSSLLLTIVLGMLTMGGAAAFGLFDQSDSNDADATLDAFIAGLVALSTETLAAVQSALDEFGLSAEDALIAVALVALALIIIVRTNRRSDLITTRIGADAGKFRSSNAGGARARARVQSTRPSIARQTTVPSANATSARSRQDEESASRANEVEQLRDMFADPDKRAAIPRGVWLAAGLVFVLFLVPFVLTPLVGALGALVIGDVAAAAPSVIWLLIVWIIFGRVFRPLSQRLADANRDAGGTKRKSRDI